MPISRSSSLMTSVGVEPSRIVALQGIRLCRSMVTRMGFLPLQYRVVRLGLSVMTVFVPTIMASLVARKRCDQQRVVGVEN